MHEMYEDRPICELGTSVGIVALPDFEPAAYGLQVTDPQDVDRAWQFTIPTVDMEIIGRMLERYVDNVLTLNLDTSQAAAKYTWWSVWAGGDVFAQSMTLHGFEHWVDAGPVISVLFAPIWWDRGNDRHWGKEQTARVVELFFTRDELAGFGRALQRYARQGTDELAGGLVCLESDMVGPHRLVWHSDE